MKAMENWKVELIMGENTLAVVKFQKGDLPGKLLLTTTIWCLLITWEVHWGLQIYKIQRYNESLYIRR